MITKEEMNSTNIFNPTQGEPTPNSPKRLARIAGIFYLLVAIFGGFAQAFVYPKIYVAGDAAATAGNLLANSGLVRAGVVSDLIQATAWVFVAMTLYLLFKHVNKGVAGAMIVFAAIGAGITCLNAGFEFEALRVATGAANLSAFGTVGSNSLALLLVDAHHYGLFIAQIFFGLWLVPMGYLAYKSGWFPKALGIVLIVSCVSYLVDLLAAFLAPEVSVQIHGFLSIPPTIAEPWMLGYLLLIGVRSVKPAKHVLPAAIAMPGTQA
ncbi:MAG: DUF4386 domain-containing protein [Chloroflexi bacterium]|nr:DUF4386 domain-containing protein [Chloroflexota bacterium]